MSRLTKEETDCCGTEQPVTLEQVLRDKARMMRDRAHTLEQLADAAKHSGINQSLQMNILQWFYASAEGRI